MNLEIKKIQTYIEPLRQSIVQHPVYGELRTQEELKIFMEHHVFAVWDFMSLLKSLQKNLTCVDVPWVPRGDAETRYLINEIVCGEESDIDESGVHLSHFELYLQAMDQAGADPSQILTLISELTDGRDVIEILDEMDVDPSIKDFVKFTFHVINHEPIHVQAAIFTFGREDLIPGMFHTLVNDLHTEQPAAWSTFKYYLDRHIEVDGGHHSALALRMVSKLCGTDTQKWEEARIASYEALQRRALLWQGVLNTIQLQNQRVEV
jgi:hypothetical protein